MCHATLLMFKREIESVSISHRKLKVDFLVESKALLICFFLFLLFPTVLDSNPWRETSKPVYVLTQKENQLCTMKTRRNRRFDPLLSCFIFPSK